MKKRYFIVSAILMLTISLTACGNKTANDNVTLGYNDAAKLLTEVKTTQFFTEEKVADEDAEKILSAGVNAPSAMNTQPWHFTAVTNEEVMQKLADAMNSMKPPAMKDGDSGMPPARAEGMEGKQPPADAPKDMPKPPEGGAGFSKMPNKVGIGDAPLTIVISCKEGSELDAGLAVQNMSAEAQLLGYGTKIMTAPTMALNNDEYKEMLSVPEGQKIAAVLIVGKPATEEDNPDAVSSATIRNDFSEVVTIISQ
ncbi:MAG: nitroreductase family protein [Clostridia bacterium]|nr:nitroreductase family protein [Clostridia bacterium]